jgi:hypothetical protein
MRILAKLREIMQNYPCDFCLPFKKTKAAKNSLGPVPGHNLLGHSLYKDQLFQKCKLTLVTKYT